MKLPILFVVLGVLTFASFAYMAYVDWDAEPPASGERGASEWAQRAQRGDYWGGHISAAASSSTVLFLIAGILMQRREIKMMSESMEEQKDHLEGQAKHLEEAGKLQEQQVNEMRRLVKAMRMTSHTARILELTRQRDLLIDRRRHGLIDNGEAELRFRSIDAAIRGIVGERRFSASEREVLLGQAGLRP